MFWISLPHRGVITVSGADRKTFLQGLITQDVFKLKPEQALFGAFLTPQGKYLYDFFMLEQEDKIYLECDRDILEAFLKRLKAYQLRLQVTFEDVSPAFTSIAVIGGDDIFAAFHLSPLPGQARQEGNSFIFVDPRLSDLGVRLLLTSSEQIPAHILEGSFLDYDLHRLQWGIPEGRRDLIPEKAILLENGFEELGAISWEKGCYLGQELTARTHYRGLVRKRLIPLKITGPTPAFGAPLFNQEGKEVGEMRSAEGAFGLAMIRLEAFFALQEKGGTLQTEDGKTQVKPYLLTWMSVTLPSS